MQFPGKFCQPPELQPLPQADHGGLGGIMPERGWPWCTQLDDLARHLADGVISPPTKCNRCGKTTGRIDYHNSDYSDPIKSLVPLCQGCHMKLHREENINAATVASKDKN